MCCMCNGGVCHHVGPHFFCAKHGGVVPSMKGLPMGFATPAGCEHCYCTTERPKGRGKAHKVCCNCGNKQAVQSSEYYAGLYVEGLSNG